MSLIKYISRALLLVSLVSQSPLVSADTIKKNFQGVLSAQASGTFSADTAGFSIGTLIVTDPLLIGIPNSQSAFALQIPINFAKKQKKDYAVIASYFVDTATLIGQTLTGTNPTPGTVETVELSVTGVTDFGFILNLAFFIHNDPGFTPATIPSLVSQLATRGFGINYITKSPS
jgi:hypothetical protein